MLVPFLRSVLMGVRNPSRDPALNELLQTHSLSSLIATDKITTIPEPHFNTEVDPSIHQRGERLHPTGMSQSLSQHLSISQYGKASKQRGLLYSRKARNSEGRIRQSGFSVPFMSSVSHSLRATEHLVIWRIFTSNAHTVRFGNRKLFQCQVTSDRAGRPSKKFF